MSGIHNAVTLTEGVTATTKWRQWLSDNHIPEHQQIKAFFIPIVDLQELVKETNAIGVRAYFGLKKEQDGKEYIHLYLVGVEINPDDPISGGLDIIHPLESDPNSNPNVPYSIYDFTDPCPHVCDPTSPLF